MFVSVSDDFTNLRHEQDAKLLFEPECTILGYQSCEASIQSVGPKMMFGSVSEHFANLRHVKGANSYFGPECTISGNQSCEASILVHWTQNDVCEYLG
jgi:hypothetical protein